MLVLLRRFLLVLLVLTGLFFALSPFLVPWLVERTAQDAFNQSVQGELSIEHTSFNPFSLKLEIEGASVVAEDGITVVALRALRVDLAWRSLWAGNVEVEELALLGPDILLALDEQGAPKALQMLKPSRDEQTASDSNATILKIKQLLVQEGQLEVQDSKDNRLKTGETNLVARDITTEAGKAFDLSELLVPLAEGRLHVAGDIKHSPFEIDVRIKAEDLPATTIASLAAGPDVTVTDGLASGDITVKYTGKLEVDGKIDLKNFAVETPGSLKQAKLAQFTVSAFSFDTEENQLTAEAGVVLNELFVETDTPLKSLGIDAVNVTDLSYDLSGNQLTIGPVKVTSPDVLLQQGQAGGEEPSVEIDDESNVEPAHLGILLPELTVEHGRVRYLDNSLPGDSQIEAKELNILLQDLKIADVAEGTFDISALVADASPFTAKGNFRQSETLTLDGRFVLDKLSHQVLSPYTEAFIGRSSEEGSLYIDMDYTITDNQLDGKNTLLFDRWSWGNAVEGYEGDAVPVDMAFALLQDSNGRVNMNIPVQGDLNDPSIKIGALVRKATTNVVTKLVSSPFKLLGSLIPGGKSDLDLTKVKFDASVAEMAPIEKAKLDALAVALKERPRLKLELAGEAYQATDLLPAAEEGSEPVKQAEPALKRLAITRADTVYQLLLEQGIPAERLSTSMPKVEMSDKNRTPYVRLKLIK